MFERGFKSWCENVALQMRAEIGLTREAPLPSEALARYLEVQLWTPQQIDGLSQETLNILLHREMVNWSAITVSCDGQDAVIYNPSHSPGRQSADVMHELAHILMGHRPATVLVSPNGALALRSFDKKQEEEANWLSGCLLLPRPALLVIVQTRIGNQEASRKYQVSDDLLTYRINKTGVATQVRRRGS